MIYPLLSKIDTTSDLKLLKLEQLPQLCSELRSFLIESIKNSSGHFASNLGTIELTVALHYVFSSPEEPIIWDVGHQAYAHKVLTGRKDKIHTIRKKNGIHPFPFRKESEHDILSVGHSSTSISAALGISAGNKLKCKKNNVIAVIGDGAITAGMAFEAMNHGGHLENTPITIIYNDNNMSISKNTGALNKISGEILSSKAYKDIREVSKTFLEIMPKSIQDIAKSAENSMKFVMNSKISTLFQSLGFNYIGIVDGHNVIRLVKVFQNYKNSNKSQLIHIVTKKGKGYSPAELDPIKYHAISNKNIHIENKLQTYSEVFGEWICNKASQDKDLVAITPAMCEGSGLVKFSNDFPDRYFDVAIAEQHAVTFATGLSIAGKKPIVSIYSTFLQRAYDQLIHDVALDNHNILFAIDRAGIVGQDGQTHQGAFDISYLRAIPNIVICCPSNKKELIKSLNFAYDYNGSIAVRYPRGNAYIDNKDYNDWQLGKSIQVRTSSNTLKIKIIFLVFGTLINNVNNTANNYDADVYDMRFVKPIDLELINKLSNYDFIITIEENSLMGGAGSAILEHMQEQFIYKPVLRIGIHDNFVPPGEQSEIYKELGLDSDSIEKKVSIFIESYNNTNKINSYITK